MVISGKTRFFALIGNPVENSFSPIIYNNAFKMAGYDGVYAAFGVEPSLLPKAVEGIKGLGISGVNVTAPFKEKVIPLLDHISSTANVIGAVNTILNAKGVLKGYNTDYIGFIRQLFDIFNGLNKRESWSFTLLGAGGAARAILYALLLFFDYLPENHIDLAKEFFEDIRSYITKDRRIKKIMIVNRDQEKAYSLKQMFEKLAGKKRIPVSTAGYKPENFHEVANNCDVFINATSLGFKGSNVLDGKFRSSLFSGNQVVIDLVYNPGDTSFIGFGKKSGAMVFTGLDMLIYQAEASFYLFTGRQIPFEPIREQVLLYSNENNK